MTTPCERDECTSGHLAATHVIVDRDLISTSGDSMGMKVCTSCALDVKQRLGYSTEDDFQPGFEQDAQIRRLPEESTGAAATQDVE